MKIKALTKRDKILYTLRHKVAFLKVEKELCGRISWRGIMHDMDKVWMYLTTNKPVGVIHKIHRSSSRHHNNGILKSYDDYVEMVIDWECARFTKPDKPLNAYDTMNKFYPFLKVYLEPILVEFGINKSITKKRDYENERIQDEIQDRADAAE